MTSGGVPGQHHFRTGSGNSLHKKKENERYKMQQKVPSRDRARGDGTHCRTGFARAMMDDGAEPFSGRNFCTLPVDCGWLVSEVGVFFPQFDVYLLFLMHP